jgi:hypothetical protein
VASHLDRIERAVDLVGRGEDERRGAALRPDRLEHVERAARVHLEILDRIGEAVVTATCAARW